LISIIAGLVVVLGVSAYFLFFRGENDNNIDGVSGLRAIPNEARILMELSEHGLSIIPRTQSINKVEILEHETDSDVWSHYATILVHSSDADVTYVKYATMLYYRNEEREWILSGVQPERTNQWLTAPLRGVQKDFVESSIRSSLLWQQVMIDNDEWQIDENTIENVIINSQNTNLDNRKDVVIVTVVLGSEALIAQGQVETVFVFNDGWQLSDFHEYASFISEYRPEAVFELSNEQLLDELLRYDVTISRDIVFERQSITFDRENIFNFSISTYESSNKGANRAYSFSFNIKKGIITYTVDAQVFYQYDNINSWIIYEFDFTPHIFSVLLEGSRWVGTYNTNLAQIASSHITVDITEVTADGAIRATVTGYPLEARRGWELPTISEYSHNSVGTIDIDSLAFNLIFDEWIVEPDVSWQPGPRTFDSQTKEILQFNLNGRINADGDTTTYYSSLLGNPFEITLAD
jgi:hypothetical protein